MPKLSAVLHTGEVSLQQNSMKRPLTFPAFLATPPGTGRSSPSSSSKKQIQGLKQLKLVCNHCCHSYLHHLVEDKLAPHRGQVHPYLQQCQTIKPSQLIPSHASRHHLRGHTPPGSKASGSAASNKALNRARQAAV